MARARARAPGLAERVRGATRADRFRGTSRLPNFYRRPYGDGWALVGDAGYHKDPILALGISRRVPRRRAARRAIDGLRAPSEALAGYERRRNELSRRRLQQHARLRAPAAAARRDAASCSRRCATARRTATASSARFAGTVPAEEFFAPDNIARILVPLADAA